VSGPGTAQKPLGRPDSADGWNSYDAYDCTINEQQFGPTSNPGEGAEQFRWQYAVIDFLWYNPVLGTPDDLANRKGNPDLRLDAQGHPLDKLDMDKYGRLLPSVNRFPSAANGAGFKPIADFVHAKGLKISASTSCAGSRGRRISSVCRCSIRNTRRRTSPIRATRARG